MRMTFTMLSFIICLACKPAWAQDQSGPTECSDQTIWNGSVWSNGTPDADDLAIFAGNFNSAGDISACAVEVQTGTVRFNPGHTLSVENSVQVDATAQLVFENSASLVQINNAVNSGNIIYKRNTNPISEYEYTYWSSPVAQQNLFTFSPDTRFDKYLFYNPVTSAWGIIQNGAGSMVPGKGYSIRGPHPFGLLLQSFQGVFVGTPNNGIITAPMVQDSYSLIGNPYPSAIDADCLIMDQANTAMGGALYFWSHNVPIVSTSGVLSLYDSTKSGYSVYNLLGGVAAGITLDANQNPIAERPTGKIGAGVGFFVKANATGTVTFSNNLRRDGSNGQNSQFFRSSATETPSTCAVAKHRLWLQIEAAGTPSLFQQMLVGYADGATTNTSLDRNFDAEALTSDSTIELCTLSPNDTKLTIQGRAIPANFDMEKIPLSVIAPAGNIKISVSDDDGLFDERIYYLREVINTSPLTYAYHDIKSVPYVFNSATPINSTTRFAIVFAASGPPIRTVLCGATLPAIYNAISVDNAQIPAGTTAYRYRVTNQNNPAEVQLFTTTDPFLKLTNLASYEYDTTYKIEVAVKVNGAFGNYGPACTVSSPSLFSGPVAINVQQCGTVLPQTFTRIFITGPNFITGTKVRVTKLSTPAVTYPDYEVVGGQFKLSQVIGAVAPNSTDFLIQVSMKTTGAYSPFTTGCIVKTPNAPAARMSADKDAALEATTYPNPYNDSFNISIDSNSEASISVAIYDVLGRLLESRTSAAADINATQFGSGLPSGVYNVILTQSGSIKTFRVIKR